MLGIVALVEDRASYFLGVGQEISDLLLAQVLPLPELVLQIGCNFLNLNIFAVGIELLKNSHGVGDNSNVQRFLDQLVLQHGFDVLDLEGGVRFQADEDAD